MAQSDYYKILQLDPEAEQEIVRVVYHKLSLKYHPDGSDPNPEKMRLLNEAYDVVGNPARRKRYDAHRQYYEKDSLSVAGSQPRSPRYWDPPTQPFSSAASTPRRRYRTRQAPGPIMIFGALAVMAFAAVLLQSAFSATEKAVSSAAVQPTLTATPVRTLMVRRTAIEGDFAPLGFTFGPVDPSQGEGSTGTNTATGASITMIDGDGALASITLDMHRDDNTSQDTIDAQTGYVKTLVAQLPLTGASQKQIVQWVDLLRNSQISSTATLTLEGLELKAEIDTELHSLFLSVRPAP